MKQLFLVVADEANAPVTDPQAVFGGHDSDETHHISVGSPRESLDRVNDAASHGRIESLQVSSCMR